MSIITESTVFELLASSGAYPVDFDLAWKWLGYSRKNNAKAAFLECGFQADVDFEVLLNNQQSDNHAGLSVQEQAVNARVEKIQLTVDCLKMWAMMAGTAKGKEVRLYFLECEKKYKQLLRDRQNPYDWQTNVQDYNRVLQREMKARISWRDGSKESTKLMCTAIAEWSKAIKESDPNSKVGQQIFAEVADEINRLITGEIAGQMRQRLGVKKYELIRDFMPVEVLRHYWLATSHASFLICKQQMHPVSAAFQATIWALPAGHIPAPIEFEIDVALVRKQLDIPGVEQLLLPWAIA